MRRSARNRRPVGLLVATLAAIGLAAAPVSAEDWTYDLAAELMSPFCPGRTLSSCPSPQAGELIQWISTQEAAGASREEVEAMLVERFGEEILASPPAEGITLWAYVFPVAGFLLFGVIAFLVLRRIVVPGGAAERGPGGPPTVASRPPDSRVPASDPLADSSDEELARLVEAELAERN